MTLFSHIHLLKNYEIVDALVRKVQTGDQKYIFNELGDDLYSAMGEIYQRGYTEALSQVKLDVPDYRVGVKGSMLLTKADYNNAEKSSEVVVPTQPSEKAVLRAVDAGRGRKAKQVARTDI